MLCYARAHGRERSTQLDRKDEKSYLPSICCWRTLALTNEAGEDQFHESLIVIVQQPPEEGSLVCRRHPVRGDGVLRRRLRPEGHGHPVRLPDRPAAGSRL